MRLCVASGAGVRVFARQVKTFGAPRQALSTCVRCGVLVALERRRSLRFVSLNFVFVFVRACMHACVYAVDACVYAVDACVYAVEACVYAVEA